MRIEPDLVLGAYLSVLDDAEAGPDGPEDKDEAEEDAGAEGGVVELGRVLGWKGEAERREDKISSDGHVIPSMMSELLYLTLTIGSRS